MPVPGGASVSSAIGKVGIGVVLVIEIAQLLFQPDMGPTSSTRSAEAMVDASIGAAAR